MARSLAMKQSDAGPAAAPRAALDRFVGYNLKRAYMLFQADFRDTLADGLTPRAFSVLSLAAEMPGVTQSDLSRLLGIERSGLVAIVDDLEARGFLARVAVPGDRRVQALRPTKAGEAALTEMLAAVEDHEERVLGPLNEEERATLLGLLIKLRNHEGDGEA